MLIRQIILFLLLFPAVSQAQLPSDFKTLAERIKSGEVKMVSGCLLQSPRHTAEYYLSSKKRLLWTNGGALAKAFPELLKAILQSEKHGLNPERYHLTKLSNPQALSNNDLDLLATDAFFSQAIHRSSGAVFTQKLDPDWHLIPLQKNPTEVLNQLSNSGNGVLSTLDALWPHHPEYMALLAERNRIVGLGKNIAVQTPPGPVLKPGVSNERVTLLKTRLLGPGEHSNGYDDSLRIAVVSFQEAAGLEADGIVGQATLDMLNATPASFIDKIDANLERWRWLPHELPPVMLRVNIAAFQLRAIQNNENAFSMKVVVGKPYRNTPVFTETLKYMEINPYWNVPHKLATADKLPMLKTNPSDLEKQGFEVQIPPSDKYVPLSRVDWSKVSRRSFNYQLRQKPGVHNALGQIKFMFPNKFSIYLHDTNDKKLFNKQERSFSSGCIRLSEPIKLAQWLLGNESRMEEAGNIDAMIEKGKTVRIHLNQPVPVYIVYFTAFLDDTGNISFRKDLYLRDKAIITELRKAD